MGFPIGGYYPGAAAGFNPAFCSPPAMPPAPMPYPQGPVMGGPPPVYGGGMPGMPGVYFSGNKATSRASGANLIGTLLAGAGLVGTAALTKGKLGRIPGANFVTGLLSRVPGANF